MIELIPAIDLIDGKCVRLTKGDYQTKKVYADDPVAQAKRFEQMGFRRLHLVDLDGAKSRRIVNDGVLRHITRETSLIVDFGGGVRSDEDIEKAFDAGATMTTVGSIAAMQPDLFLRWMETYGAERLILGADVRDGMISINGWQEESRQRLADFLAQYIKAGGPGYRTLPRGHAGPPHLPPHSQRRRLVHRGHPRPAAGRHTGSGLRQGHLRGAHRPEHAD